MIYFDLTHGKGINKHGHIYILSPIWIREIPDHLKTQKMCGKAAHMEPGFLKYVPDHFKTHEMCNEAIEKAQ